MGITRFIKNIILKNIILKNIILKNIILKLGGINYMEPTSSFFHLKETESAFIGCHLDSHPLREFNALPVEVSMDSMTFYMQLGLN